MLICLSNNNHTSFLTNPLSTLDRETVACITGIALLIIVIFGSIAWNISHSEILHPESFTLPNGSTDPLHHLVPQIIHQNITLFL